MSNITKDSFEETLKSLIEANAHARNKGDDFKKWCKDNFNRDSRISYVKAQQQLTNRVSEQFRYFSPIVVFVCVAEINRDKLLEYILERTYKQMETVAIIGTPITESGDYSYKYEHLIVAKENTFTEWIKPLFESVKTVSNLREELGVMENFAWFVGATGENDDGEYCDFSEQFIEQGIWINGWDNKFIDTVKDIKIGDRIAIKSVFNQKNNVPFDCHGKKVAVMRIKAVGTVTENIGDGKKLKVAWTKLEPEKDWYGPGSLRQTIHRISAEDSEIKRQLLEFAFDDGIQDFSICEEYYADEIIDMDESVKLLDELCFKTQCDDMGYERNRIIFGAPGTGKSHTLDADKDKLLERGGSFERVTFHPDYTYANFVGCYKPVPKGNDGISYKYVPGPFMRMLAKALLNSQQPHLLLIEEINRANSAAVFGEVFQLLDRDGDGVSKYEIQISEDMRKFLLGVFKESGFEINETAIESIKVPNNMYIWATMNSADQGVYPMDTAFKRRWNFEYIGIDEKEGVIDNYNFTVCNKTYNWNKLRKAINKALISKRVREDKLLGPFFIDKNILVPNNDEKFIDVFCDKVLMYLYEDAARTKPEIFSEGYRKVTFYELQKGFNNDGLAIFNTDITNSVREVVENAGTNISGTETSSPGEDI